MKNFLKNLNIKYTLGASILFAYLLMVMGTFVTSTGSGLACPDWPLCYGTVTPPLEVQVWIEWTHRLLGGTTGLLVLLSTLVVWSKGLVVEKKLMFTTLGLLGAGVVLGGVIVRTEAPLLETFTHTLIISSHLIFATLIISCLIFTYRFVAGKEVLPDTKYFAILYPLIYGQIILGILVRYSKATLACPDFPLCGGKIVPDFTHFTIFLHYSHRVLATIIIITIITFLVKTIKANEKPKSLIILLVLVLTQASLGVTIVVTGMFFPALILHGATGFFLLAFLAYKATPFYFEKNKGPKE